jgi:hypothetical protein
MNEVVLNSFARKKKKKKGVITSAVQEMRTVKISCSYYPGQRRLKERERERVRACAWALARGLPFWIYRLATESRGSTYAFMTSWQPRSQNLTMSWQPLDTSLFRRCSWTCGECMKIWGLHCINLKVRMESLYLQTNRLVQGTQQCFEKLENAGDASSDSIEREIQARIDTITR